MPLGRTRDLLILQAARRLTEVPPPIVAKAEELGRTAGKAAAAWVFDGNTPEQAYRRVLRGIEEGDPAVLDAIEPPATSASTPVTVPCPAPCRPTRTLSPAASGRKPCRFPFLVSPQEPVSRSEPDGPAIWPPARPGFLSRCSGSWNRDSRP